MPHRTPPHRPWTEHKQCTHNWGVPFFLVDRSQGVSSRVPPPHIRAAAVQVDGFANPTLTVYKDVMYYFQISTSAHRFGLFTCCNATGGLETYTDGVLENDMPPTGAGLSSGWISWMVPTSGHPASIIYTDPWRPWMNGTIHISTRPRGVQVTSNTRVGLNATSTADVGIFGEMFSDRVTDYWLSTSAPTITINNDSSVMPLPYSYTYRCVLQWFCQVWKRVCGIRNRPTRTALKRKIFEVVGVFGTETLGSLPRSEASLAATVTQNYGTGQCCCLDGSEFEQNGGRGGGKRHGRGHTTVRRVCSLALTVWQCICTVSTKCLWGWSSAPFWLVAEEDGAFKMLHLVLWSAHGGARLCWCMGAAPGAVSIAAFMLIQDFQMQLQVSYFKDMMGPSLDAGEFRSLHQLPMSHARISRKCSSRA